jgi:hypothetical protein
MNYWTEQTLFNWYAMEFQKALHAAYASETQ